MRKTMGVIVSCVLLGACRSASVREADSKATPSASPAGGSSNFRPFAVYTDRSPRHTHYAPSGYMGDSDLTVSGAYTQTPDGQGPCLKVNYAATGPKGWSGLYWQDPANNWGDVPGRAGFDLRGATKLIFWARGENGGEKVHEFRMGGIVGQYPDSDVASISNIKLSKEWKQYTIDLTGKDLRHIIGGFGLFMNKAENPGGAVFYIDDVYYVGPQGLVRTPAAVAPSTATLTGQTPPAPPAPPAPTPTPASTKDLKVQEVATGLKVSFSSQLLFAPGESNLQAAGSKVLDQVSSLLKTYPTNNVLIEGHTDSTGNAQFNLRLSELRAQSVRDYLIKQGGFDAARFKIVGYGATKPVADNKTRTGRSLNRRVEVTILKEGAS